MFKPVCFMMFLIIFISIAVPIAHKLDHDEIKQKEAMGQETYLEAKKIIAESLKELEPKFSDLQCEENARAILARLAQKNLLVEKVK